MHRTTEIQRIISQLKETFEGDPWFGRNLKAILSEADPLKLFEKPHGQHSLVQLVYHMVNWRLFVISRLQPDGTPVSHFEEKDWEAFHTANQHTWQSGLEQLFETQLQIISALEKADDELLDQQVEDRGYTYRKLLYGLVQHDIYHLGQIAYVIKLLK